MPKIIAVVLAIGGFCGLLTVGNGCGEKKGSYRNIAVAEESLTKQPWQLIGRTAL
jgi:hypothetical protein